MIRCSTIRFRTSLSVHFREDIHDTDDLSAHAECWIGKSHTMAALPTQSRPANFINSNDVVETYGSRDMPMWGQVFRLLGHPAADEVSMLRHQTLPPSTLNQRRLPFDPSPATGIL